MSHYLPVKIKKEILSLYKIIMLFIDILGRILVNAPGRSGTDFRQDFFKLEIWTGAGF